MERVARRFLLHNRRETEEVKERDFDDLKQELNMAKYEVLNSSKQIKFNLRGYEAILQRGLGLLSRYFVSKEDFSENFKKNKKHTFSKTTSDFEAEELSDPFDNETIDTNKLKET